MYNQSSHDTTHLLAHMYTLVAFGLYVQIACKHWTGMF